jgi:hypothetical protein
MQGYVMRIIFLLPLFIFFTGKVLCLEPVTALDDGFSIPYSGSMGEASFNFPGSESLVDGPYALLGYAAPFGLEDLAVSTFIVGARSGKTGISLSWNGTGGDLYHDEQEKIGISYSVLKSLHMGVRLTRNAMRIKGFGEASAWSGDVGVIFHPSEPLYFAFLREDVAGAVLGESKEPLDGRSRAVASWSLPGEITMIASVTKVRRFAPSLSGGCILGIWEVLDVGISGANEPGRIEFFSSIMVKNLKFSYRGSFQGDLGSSHGVSVSFGCNKVRKAEKGGKREIDIPL